MASWGTGLVHAAGWCLAAAEFSYVTLALLAVARFRQRPRRAPRHQPPGVSILVPTDRDFPGFEACIRSVCEQDYPTLEIVFGVHSHADTAIPVIERVIRDYPHRRITLIVDDRMLGANPKNCNLANMFPAASYDIVAMVDSDTLSGWSIDGKALDGSEKVAGKKLKPLPVEEDVYYGVMKYWSPGMQFIERRAGDPEPPAYEPPPPPKPERKPPVRRRTAARSR